MDAERSGNNQLSEDADDGVNAKDDGDYPRPPFVHYFSIARQKFTGIYIHYRI